MKRRRSAVRRFCGKPRGDVFLLCKAVAESSGFLGIQLS